MLTPPVLSQTEASAPLAKLERPSPKPLCTEAVKFFIEDAELLQRKYPLSAAHMRAIIDAVNVTTVPSVRVRVSGKLRLPNKAVPPQMIQSEQSSIVVPSCFGKRAAVDACGPA